MDGLAARLFFSAILYSYAQPLPQAKSVNG
jgi:hypothetical protein